MKYMLIGDENMGKFMTQHLPQTELVACPHATQNLCSIQTRKTHSIVAFILPLAQLQPEEMESLAELQLRNGKVWQNLAELQLMYMTNLTESQLGE